MKPTPLACTSNTAVGFALAALGLSTVLGCGSPGEPASTVGEAGPSGHDSGVKPKGDAAGPDAGAKPHDDAGAKAEASATPPSTGPNFPRLGSLLISTDSSAANAGYDSGYAEWASKIHVNVMGANWAGAGASLLGGSREALVRAIHSGSTIGSRVFEYYNTDENETYWPMSSVSGWLLYQHGTSGPCAPNSYFDSATVCNTNQTLYTPADAMGLHLEGEYAEALVATLLTGATSDAAPSLDGTFHDNTILTPTVAGDYSRDGTEEAAGDATAGQWIRDGLAEGYTELQKTTKWVTIGNLGGWGIPNAVGGGMDATGLVGVVQGGIIEGVFGDVWSAETWSGFAAAQVHYQFCMKNTGDPKLDIVHHSNLLANGSDPTAFDSSGAPSAYGPPYQALRYGLAFTLMDDGYYATTQNEDYVDTQRNWFDEFAVDPKTGVALSFPDVDAGLGYLGQPTDPAWPAAMANGVYERHFANPAAASKWLVLLNPKGNGAQTVSLGASMQKLTGTEDPAVNDGSTVTEVTLQDRDGLILKVE